MAAAIGREIKKCVVAKATESRMDVKKHDHPAKTAKQDEIKMEEVTMD